MGAAVLCTDRQKCVTITSTICFRKHLIGDCSLLLRVAYGHLSVVQRIWCPFGHHYASPPSCVTIGVQTLEVMTSQFNDKHSYLFVCLFVNSFIKSKVMNTIFKEHILCKLMFRSKKKLLDFFLYFNFNINCTVKGQIRVFERG
jgi:hypothetical protein